MARRKVAAQGVCRPPRPGGVPATPWWTRTEPLGREGRLAAAAVLGLVVSWLAYTRLYFWLHPRGLTFAPSLFMHLTGRPDPLCGLTRTFAWMWRGDLAHAVAVYPLGPLAFALSFPALAVAATALVTGRMLRVRLRPRVQRAILVVVGGTLAMNWTAKLIWLGM
jgi:hypothetical protein